MAAIENSSTMEISPLAKRLTSRLMELGYKYVSDGVVPSSRLFERECDNGKYRSKNRIELYTTPNLEQMNIDLNIWIPEGDTEKHEKFLISISLGFTKNVYVKKESWHYPGL